VTIQPYATGQESYVNIWVTGDFQTSGSGYILQQAGVHVTYWVQGSINISGQSINNQSGLAANCAFNVVNPPVGQTQSVQVSGSGTLIGTVNAPGADFNISGSASLVGAFIGNTMQTSGSGGVHYDQSLAKTASSLPGYGYTFASEVEGVR
jgi:hypothetical protein